MRVLYRVSQFWHTLSPKTDSALLVEALRQLSPAQGQLFDRLQSSEQRHALSIWCKLRDLGEDQPDLLAAALLHDVGKLHHHLRLWERVLVVLVKAVMPTQAIRWGSLPSNDWKRLPAWRKAFIVAGQHARWGAELAHNAGVSSLTEYLIREHHQPQEQDVNGVTSSLLHKLWLADNGC